MITAFDNGFEILQIIDICEFMCLLLPKSSSTVHTNSTFEN